MTIEPHVLIEFSCEVKLRVVEQLLNGVLDDLGHLSRVVVALNVGRKSGSIIHMNKWTNEVLLAATIGSTILENLKDKSQLSLTG